VDACFCLVTTAYAQLLKGKGGGELRESGIWTVPSCRISLARDNKQTGQIVVGAFLIDQSNELDAGIKPIFIWLGVNLQYGLSPTELYKPEHLDLEIGDPHYSEYSGTPLAQALLSSTHVRGN